MIRYAGIAHDFHQLLLLVRVPIDAEKWSGGSTAKADCCGGKPA